MSHDVLTVNEVGLTSMADNLVFDYARENNRFIGKKIWNICQPMTK
ncbi:DUF5615 family PIN-like protein [Crocosphaera sp. XPORK-15E]|nr:DUF5615 family PIN-like protein [Crocosphaera sp. XPORK-15E]MEA5537053.1 DUF5615 family PIN-like protein [Crocosphaera sp. XPORK-15E]